MRDSSRYRRTGTGGSQCALTRVPPRWDGRSASANTTTGSLTSCAQVTVVGFRMPTARAFFAIPLFLVLLVSCGTTSPDGTGPEDPPGSGGSSCTHTLNSNVTMPTTLAPTGAECDYLLSGRVRVNSALTIEPGTTIVAAPESMLDIDDGGRIVAVGTLDD